MTDSEPAPASQRVVSAPPLGSSAEHTAKQIQAELQTCVTDVLRTLQSVGKGDLTGRLESTFPATHPVGALDKSSSVEFHGHLFFPLIFVIAKGQVQRLQ